MVHLYKELQPADHFEISIPQFLSAHERQLITLFYQPLTGLEAICFYNTLWAEGEEGSNITFNHYHLMNVLNMPIGKVFEARIALEAIGLLRTYRKDTIDGRSFIYELMRPIEAQSFFQDPLLSMFLYSKIGEQAYRNLKTRYLKPNKTESYTEVSRTFVDVFKPVHKNVPKDLQVSGTTRKKDVPFYYHQFDFNLLFSGLSEHLVPTSAITPEVRESIAKLAFLYQLTPLDMQKVVILAIDENLKIQDERLKKAALEYYQLTISKDLPNFSKTFEESKQEKESTPSKEQELLHYYETTSPIDHLRNLNNGKEPTPYIRELVENLFIKHGMNPGVVNVLIDYVMLQTDKKLPKNFVETIADHWNRKNIRTAQEAMEFARLEHDKYNNKTPQQPELIQVKNPYDSLNVYEFLKYINEGKEPFDYIVKIADSLVKYHGLSVPVVNVLMEYAIKQTDGKVSKKFVETIASNWITLNIQTSDDALAQIQKTKDEKQSKRELLFNARITNENIQQFTAIPEDLDEDYQYYESTPPYQFLKNYYKGNEPFPMTVKLAEDLVIVYGLPVGVVNVLTEYVLTTQNGQFPKRLVDTIASSWRQLGIQTAQGAIDYVLQQKEAKDLHSKLGYVPKITPESIIKVETVRKEWQGYASLTPYEFLKHLNKGMEPLSSHVRLAESLVLKFGLTVGVTNVLIEYVYSLKSGQLPKKYVEVIANDWRNKQIQTVEQAKNNIENQEKKVEMREKVGYIPTITEDGLNRLNKERNIDPMYSKYESVTPYQFLKNLNNGNEPYGQHVRLAESLVHRFDLPVGVANVLIEYVLEVNDGKLPTKFTETIAADWRYKGVIGTGQALEIAKESVESRKQRQLNKELNPFGAKQVMPLPKWYNDRNKSPEEHQLEHDEQIDFEKERKRILEKLGNKN
ncbi:Replicative DNA helicase loader DnaB OS=Ureibacillus acetophenoni OX=614649 GN=SAMN05877842_102473 PE=4 SV=1 [Ureibacillus acetophenoni]